MPRSVPFIVYAASSCSNGRGGIPVWLGTMLWVETVAALLGVWCKVGPYLPVFQRGFSSSYLFTRPSIGVVSPFITSRGPPCGSLRFFDNSCFFCLCSCLFRRFPPEQLIVVKFDADWFPFTHVLGKPASPELTSIT